MRWWILPTFNRFIRKVSKIAFTEIIYKGKLIGCITFADKTEKAFGVAKIPDAVGVHTYTWKSIAIRYTTAKCAHESSLKNGCSWDIEWGTVIIDFLPNQPIQEFRLNGILGKRNGKAPIISVQQVEPTYRTEFDVWEYIIKLDDVSIDTEIRISIESNSFLYSYGLDDINDRIIQFPISTVITVSE